MSQTSIDDLENRISFLKKIKIKNICIDRLDIVLITLK